MNLKNAGPVLLLLVLLLLVGCAPKPPAEEGQDTANSYQQISQEEARQMMDADSQSIIVDVRRQDEYDTGHIPGAVCIPNESIGTSQPEELPDLNQVILIYCRSGRRSKEAAQKLADMGYTNVYEFGGIIDWTGDVVTEESTDETEPVTESEPSAEEPSNLKIQVSDETNTVVYQLNDSPSAVSLYQQLPLDIEVENYGGNEKIFYPPQALDTAGGQEGGGEAGGLALFSPWGNVVMYYGTFSSYPGLYLMGEAVSGVEQVENLSGTIHIEAVD